MPIIMKGAPVIKELLESADFNKDKKQVYIFTNEDDAASAIYVRNKVRKFKEVGMEAIVIECAQKSKIEVISIADFCKKEKIPYMFQLPLAPHLKEYEEELINNIPLSLDMDAMSLTAQGSFYASPTIENSPCTPLGIIYMLKHYFKDNLSVINNLNVVVIGRSAIVGRPVARLMEKMFNSTVTICHSKTKNLRSHTRNADIIIAAVGKPNFITADMVKDGAIIVDVGINRTEDGVIGDVKADPELIEKVSAISPVPGGVGPTTVGMLVYKQRNKKEVM